MGLQADPALGRELLLSEQLQWPLSFLFSWTKDSHGWKRWDPGCLDKRGLQPSPTKGDPSSTDRAVEEQETWHFLFWADGGDMGSAKRTPWVDAGRGSL